MTLRRLHWGCGPRIHYGWVNSDLEPYPGVDVVADVTKGLPFTDAEFDCIVSIHVLPEIAYCDLDQTLRELLRILKPGGVLRLGLPDLELAFRAWQKNDIDYFLIDDNHVRTLSGKLIVQLTWFGRSRCQFTFEFIEELLTRNGYVEVTRCSYQQTGTTLPGITALDDRPLESLFVEARRPNAPVGL